MDCIVELKHLDKKLFRTHETVFYFFYYMFSRLSSQKVKTVQKEVLPNHFQTNVIFDRDEKFESHIMYVK